MDCCLTLKIMFMKNDHNVKLWRENCDRKFIFLFGSDCDKKLSMCPRIHRRWKINQNIL